MSVQRRQWVLLVTLWFAVLASAAGAIYTSHRAREQFVEPGEEAPPDATARRPA